MKARIFNIPQSGAAEILRTAPTPGVPPYGQEYYFKALKIPLDTARVLGDTAAEYDITGDFVWIISASDTSALVQCRFNKQTSDDIPLSQGTYIEAPFNRLWLSWAAQVGKFVTIAYGRPSGFVQNPAIAVNQVSLSGNLNGVVERPTTLVDAADVAVPVQPTVTLLRAQTATDRRRIFVNTGANPVRIGTAPALATGALVLPNGSITLMGNYAVSACGIGGASTVSVTVEAD